MVTKGSAHQKDKIILNLHTLDNMPSKIQSKYGQIYKKKTNPQNERFNNWQLLKEADFKN